MKKLDMKNVDQVYYKLGRRYIPFGPQEWEGFPSDGVWLVQIKPGHRSEELILKLGDLPELYPFARMMVSKDDLSRVIMRVLERGTYNASDLATEVIKWLAEGGKSDEAGKV
jgi:hypothetical protein